MPPALFVALPALDEYDFLPKTLDSIAAQHTSAKFEVFVCVNQPDSYWHNPDKKEVCHNNAKTLHFLNNYEKLTLHIIDKCSPGLGWENKKSGVGFARKILMDTILGKCSCDDIIISLDADTLLEPTYFQSVYDNFTVNRHINAISVPYYHKIDGCSEENARAVLRYEIYMRNYLINLLKIKSPYSFTALGSAIAVKACALSKIGGITPYQSGEDFYLLQKIAKMGGLSIFNTDCVYPSPRVSNRVPFGTGPAVGMGISGGWESYPVYHHSAFAPIGEAYCNLRRLYDNEPGAEKNMFLEFVAKRSRNTGVWMGIRGNVTDYQHFEKAFHQKADGLRILQFVRARHSEQGLSDEASLLDNLRLWFPGRKLTSDHFNFKTSPVDEINHLRDSLFMEEMRLRGANR